MLGEVEEYFANLLRPGDTFMFAGRLLQFLRMHEMAVECAEGGTGEPMVPAYEGGRLPLTTNLADRVRGLLQDPSRWGAVSRTRCRNGCGCNARGRACPAATTCWWRRFPRGDRWYLVAYCFEGRNAHQTLGHAADAADGARRAWRRWGSSPPTTCWASGRPNRRADVAALFDQDMLGDDLEAWMAESSMLRRTFRNVAVIAGLIERHHPGRGEDRAGR